MNLDPMTTDDARLALRALKTVATQGGTAPLSHYHRAALAAFQNYVAQSSLDVDALEPVTPAELARAFPDPATRTIAVHDLCFMALADPDAVSEARLGIVESFAKELGVEAAIIEATRHTVRRQMVRLQIDAMRMMLPPEEGWTHKLAALWKAVAPFMGVTDAKTAARYRALESHAPGTLGRTYFEFIHSRGFKFPGEKGGAPEMFFVPHDLTHILTGYATDRDGEVQIIGYQAGYGGGPNPLAVILLALAQVQLGIVLDPVAPALTGELDFDLLLRGLRRGAQAKIDFTGGDWDYWADLDQPVEAVREKYGVVPD